MRNFLTILLLLVALGGYSADRATAMEIRYNALAARFDARDKALANDLQTYLQTYPYSTFIDEVKFMQGVLLVEKGLYSKAAKTLESVDTHALTRPHQTDYAFYRGYAYLMLQEYERAAIYFDRLRKADNTYTRRSTYYFAYCHYKAGNYDLALPALQQLESAPEYRKTVPFFITQIEYAQGHIEEAESRATTLLHDQPDNENNTELRRILGEIQYRRGDYPAAAKSLQDYVLDADTHQEEPLRSDLYMLGVTQYQLGQYDQAIQALKRIKQLADTLSEAACLTMGHAYVQLSQLEQAKLAYQAAASLALTPTITEEASYNYTLCAYRTASALGESVHACKDFLNRFPSSQYESRIYQLLSDALMQSKNYAEALATLNSIASPTPRMHESKQYLRYQLAVDAFLQSHMEETIRWCTEIIDHTSESSRYTAEAYYLRAEAHYRLTDYAACEKDLTSFFARPEAKSSDNYVLARYLQGYCFFAQSKYDQARVAFSSYIDAAPQSLPTYPDALNRLGDCYFNARSFDKAILYYTLVSDAGARAADYALFQKAYALGLQHKYTGKIDALRTLIERYPQSDYADDGLYEIARAQLQLDRQRDAIASYDQLIDSYPHSTLVRKASLERAMLYRNLHLNDQAIAAYRYTIESYPASEEAYAALEALQSIYVEAGKVDEYMAYTKTLASLNMSVSAKEDSLLFVAAEIRYMNADYPEALTQYTVLAERANPYREEAATRVASILFDLGRYEEAIPAFQRMQTLASSREQRNIARVGVLRSAQRLDRYPDIIEAATLILTDSPVPDELSAEATYARAKAYISLSQWDKAIPDLETLSVEVRTATGAEAKYLLAQAYYELQRLDESEAQVMAFTQMNTSHQYWLARALILLSDINLRRGDVFQARQYLLVLSQNYTRTGDDIPSLIQSRLNALDAIDQPVEKEETNEL